MNINFNQNLRFSALTALFVFAAMFVTSVHAQDCCDQGDKPRALTMEYVGGDCSASANSQDDKTECDNFGGGLGSPASVYIEVTEDDDGDGDVYFAGPVT
jgi:hypothetical protein